MRATFIPFHDMKLVGTPKQKFFFFFKDLVNWVGRIMWILTGTSKCFPKTAGNLATRVLLSSTKEYSSIYLKQLVLPRVYVTVHTMQTRLMPLPSYLRNQLPRMKAAQRIKRKSFGLQPNSVVRTTPKSPLLRDNLVWYVGAKQTASVPPSYLLQSKTS